MAVVRFSGCLLVLPCILAACGTSPEKVDRLSDTDELKFEREVTSVYVGDVTFLRFDASGKKELPASANSVRAAAKKAIKEEEFDEVGSPLPHAATLSVAMHYDAPRAYKYWQSYRKKVGSVTNIWGQETAAIYEKGRVRKTGYTTGMWRGYVTVHYEGRKVFHARYKTESGGSLEACAQDWIESALSYLPHKRLHRRGRPVFQGNPREVTNTVGMKLIRLPAGQFMMGSPKNEEKRSQDEAKRRTTIPKTFYMGVEEITRGQFEAFLRDTEYRTEAEREGFAHKYGKNEWEKEAGATWKTPGIMQTDEHPVTCVSWNDAVKFCEWLSRREGLTYRLPTSAEWEYACRAGRASPFHSGGTISSDDANYVGTEVYGKGKKGVFLGKTTPVASYKPNRWGFFDMHGNVWEWCADEQEEGARLKGVPEDIPLRVMRGGCYWNAPNVLRSACWSYAPQSIRRTGYGFRIVLEIPGTEPAVESEEGRKEAMREARARYREWASTTIPEDAPLVVVAPEGGDHTSVQAAIQAAQPHTRILVKPGMYKEALILTKPVEIIGDGPREKIVIESTDKPVIHMKADHAFVHNLSLRDRCSGDIAKKVLGVYMTRGRFVIDACDVTSATSCFMIRGKESMPLIRNCFVYDGGKAGIVAQGCGGEVENCDIHGHTWSGIEIAMESSLAVRNCRIHDMMQNGMFFHRKATGSVDDCEIFGNTHQGIRVDLGSDPQIRNAKVYRNGGTGIWVLNDGKGTFENCVAFKNGAFGLETRAGGNPTIRNCRIYANKSHGVLVVEKGAGTLEDCMVYANTHSGIVVSKEGNPTVRRCLIFEGKQAGVFIMNNGKGTFEDCDIFGNTFNGVEVKDGGQPTVLRCKIRNGKANGIFAHKNGKGTFGDCDIAYNANSGLATSTGARPTLRNCRINYNEKYAIQILKDGGGIVESCDLRRNGKDAWSSESGNVVRNNNRD
jgi:parallel beta-helix repeat protein